MESSGNPTPIKIMDTEKPVPVEVMPQVKKDVTLVNREDNKSVIPSTTEQQDIATAGQRLINLIWEQTQAKIAKTSVYSTIVINASVIFFLILLACFGIQVSTVTITIILASLASLNTTQGIIIGFYFSRTNHEKVGGIGPKSQIPSTEDDRR